MSINRNTIVFISCCDACRQSVMKDFIKHDLFKIVQQRNIDTINTELGKIVFVLKDMLLEKLRGYEIHGYECCDKVKLTGYDVAFLNSQIRS